MATKKRLIVIAAGGAVCFAGACALVSAWGLGFFGKGSIWPVYQLEQTTSSHAGYLRTTLTHGNDIHVNDFEEAALRLATSEPARVIGHMGIEIDNVRAIPGQPVTAYVACDVGSEMPAYEPFRNSRQPAFDWRAAAFRAMTFAWPGGARSPVKTTDPALLAEMVRLLRDGTPVSLPAMPATDASKLGSASMESDQLPGLLFCPPVYIDAKGTIYIAENLMMDFKASPPQCQAHWITASPTLVQWLK